MVGSDWVLPLSSIAQPSSASHRQQSNIGQNTATMSCIGFKGLGKIAVGQIYDSMGDSQASAAKTWVRPESRELTELMSLRRHEYQLYCDSISISSVHLSEYSLSKNRVGKASPRSRVTRHGLVLGNPTSTFPGCESEQKAATPVFAGHFGLVRRTGQECDQRNHAFLGSEWWALELKAAALAMEATKGKTVMKQPRP
ncbi:hypothetical protein B0H66DRAFT_4737 [Apodospora peruviana]|uniref:Uncharacterized protein n=1 Tax=Apodospora peruviana TaxID=516989 RepID=A0AAE0IPQ0_9PEZI|nr:hypothetical protein B0H66DRAFT_4737 [Apodospora peruviana]